MGSPGRTIAYAVVILLLVSTFTYLTYTYTRRVTGSSMYPTLEDGDLVVLQSVPYASIHAGNIIVYDPPCANSGLSVIHRVINVTGSGFITKGDNNGYTDQSQDRIASSPITQDCVVGEVVFVVPYLEDLASLPYGLNYVLAALIVLYVLYVELSGRRNKAGNPTQGLPP